MRAHAVARCRMVDRRSRAPKAASPGVCRRCSPTIRGSSTGRRRCRRRRPRRQRRPRLPGAAAARASPTVPPRCSPTPSTTGVDTSCSSRRRSCTARTPTTRSRSPRTPCCGPTSTFVFARQLATAEALVDEWRRAAPGRRAAVLRPVVAMAADGTSSLAARPRRRIRPALRRGRPAGPVPASRRPRFAPSRSPSTAGSTASSTWRPTAGSPANECVPSAGRSCGSSCPSGSPRWSGRCAGGSSAGRSRPGCAPTRATPWLVANDRLQGARLAADGHQRAGLRRGHRGEVVDDDHAEAPSGAGARRDGRRVAGGDGRRCQSSPPLVPPTLGGRRRAGGGGRRRRPCRRRRRCVVGRRRGRRGRGRRGRRRRCAGSSGRRRTRRSVVVVVGGHRHRPGAVSCRVAAVHKPTRSPSASSTGVPSSSSRATSRPSRHGVRRLGRDERRCRIGRTAAIIGHLVAVARRSQRHDGQPGLGVGPSTISTSTTSPVGSARRQRCPTAGHAPRVVTPHPSSPIGVDHRQRRTLQRRRT